MRKKKVNKMDEYCRKCDVKLNKHGKMNSGNSLYDLFMCPGCGKESMKALGPRMTPQVF